MRTLAHRGDYNDIGRTFERLSIWAAGKPGIFGPATKMFGIYYDDPASKAVADLRSDACVTVPDDFVSDAEHPIKHTPGGRCAVLVHTGPYSELHLAYDWLYREWLPKSGESPGDQPCFEDYLNDPRTAAPSDLKTAICVPLK